MKKNLLSLFFAACFSSFSVAQTIILTEDFEAGTTIPTGWVQITSATDGGYKFNTNTVVQSTSFPIPAHTKMACTNDDACNCDKSNDILYTPSMDLSSYTNVFLSYDCYYFNLSYQGITEEAKIVASTDGGVTWTDVVTVAANSGTGWQNNFANLSSLAGNANVMVGFKYNDGGGWLYGFAIDNVSIYEPVSGLDLAVSSILVGKTDPTPAFVGFTKYLNTLPLNIQINILNQNTTTINSFDLSWTDGINTQNESVTGVNISPLSTYTFFATTPYTTLNGVTTITATISNVNGGASELTTANNVATYNVEGVNINPDRNYFAEEATGTWCGWCPRGTVFMEYMHDSYPDKFNGVAVHNADPMVLAAYDVAIGGLIAGYPSVVSNRDAIIDPSQLEGDFIDYISTAPSVVLSGSATLNNTTNTLTVDLNGLFSQNLNGDYRFAAVLTEDSLHGTAANWRQNNYYTGNANGPMGGFELLPAYVPAAQMYYEFVGRALLGGFGGQAGSLPAAIASGSTYSYQLTSPVTALWNENQFQVFGLVIETSTGHILNSARIPLTITTGINNINLDFNMSLYPNPANDMIGMSLNLTKQLTAGITVYDAVGKVVLSQNIGTLSAGKHNLQSDISQLAKGVYQLKLTTDNGVINKQFIKQ